MATITAVACYNVAFSINTLILAMISNLIEKHTQTANAETSTGRHFSVIWQSMIPAIIVHSKKLICGRHCIRA
jgi:hypothetical protein